MIAFAISLAHWLLISISMSVLPVSSILPPTWAMAARNWWSNSPILRALDVTLQLWIAEIPQGVDAADQFVELEDRAPRRVRLGVGAQLPDQGALGHFLEAQCRYDLIDVGVSFAMAGW